MLAKHQNVPGYEGKFQIGHGVIDNPYDGQREYRTKNIRECPTDQMHARKQIGDAQNEAATRYRALVEASQGGSFGVIDTSYEPVDQSPTRDKALTDKKRNAARSLQEISALVGKESEAMLRAIAGEGVPVSEYAKRWASTEAPSEFEKKYIGRRYREALKELAVYFGLESER